MQRIAHPYCTGCKYCLPCENGVNIPVIFEQYNVGRVYGIWEQPRRVYAWLEKEQKDASVCSECGACEEKCPQHLPIRAQLEEAHAALVTQQ